MEERYTSWRIVTFTINQKGGEAEFTERITPEEGETEAELKQRAILRYHSTCASYGSNKATKNCTVMLFDKNGGLFKTESFKQSAEPEPVA